MTSQHPSDATLFRRVAADDQTALEYLLREHKAAVLDTAFRYLGEMEGPEEVSDVFQEVALRLWRQRKRFLHWNDHLGAEVVLRRYAKDSALGIRRMVRRRRELLEGSFQETSLTVSREHGIILELEIDRILNRWPKEDRALLQAVTEGRTYSELARRFGKSPGALRVQVSRLRAHLRQAIGFDREHETGSD